MKSNGRAQFIDSARGIAMILVLVAHFAWIYFERNPGHAYAGSILIAMQIAAPTFMLISGFLLGYVHQQRGGQLGTFGVKLVDRGLFLLTIGHIVISLAYVAYADGFGGAFRFSQITDAVAVAIIAGPTIVARFAIKVRFALAAGLFVICWLLIAYWIPESTSLQWVKDTLIGAEAGRRSQWSYSFPIVPWCSLYVVATCIGEKFARLAFPIGSRALTQFLVRLSFASISVAIAAKVSIWIVKYLLPTGAIATSELLYLFTNPLQKWPPSLGYFAFYGGLGLLILALTHLGQQHPRFAPSLRLFGLIGRNSLFVFLLQEHVYVSWLWLIDPPDTVLWPFLLLLSILVVIALTLAWERINGIRYLTVGYGRIWGPTSYRAVDSKSPADRRR